MIDPKQFYPKLEKMGIEEVSRQLTSGLWGEEKSRLARGWLESADLALSNERHAETIKQMDTGNTIANRANLYAKIGICLALLALVVELILHWPQ